MTARYELVAESGHHGLPCEKVQRLCGMVKHVEEIDPLILTMTSAGGEQPLKLLALGKSII